MSSDDQRTRADFLCHRPPVTRLHLSLTSDGFFVTWRTFRKLAEKHGFRGIDFVGLNNSRSVTRVERKVEFAHAGADLFRLDWWCDECKCHGKVLGLPDTALIARAEAPLDPLEMVETRLRSGTELLPGDAGGWTSLHAHLIVGDEVARILREKKFRSVRFHDIGWEG